MSECHRLTIEPTVTACFQQSAHVQVLFQQGSCLPRAGDGERQADGITALQNMSFPLFSAVPSHFLICVCAHVFVCTCMHAHVAHLYVYICVCRHTCVGTFVCACACVWVHVDVHLCVPCACSAQVSPGLLARCITPHRC